MCRVVTSCFSLGGSGNRETDSFIELLFLKFTPSRISSYLIVLGSRRSLLTSGL